MAGLRQHWRATNRQRLFSHRRAAAWLLRSAGCARANASGDLAQLLLRCLLVVRNRLFCRVGPLRNAGSVCDQKTIGARIVAGTMKTINLARRRRDQAIMLGQARRFASGKRDAPGIELRGC